MSSAWGEMRRRSAGEEITKEDFAQIYYDNDSAKKPIVTVEEKAYKDFNYKVLTNGDYPSLDIRVKTEVISIFTGYNMVILKCPDGQRYELDRRLLSSGETQFVYDFNKDGDYIHSSSYKRCTDEGHKYILRDLEQYAEMFIDKILQCEDDLPNHME